MCRIQAELADILLDPPCGIMAAPKDNNMYYLIVLFDIDMNGKQS